MSGPVAAEWIAIAQAFAGVATGPRPPGAFTPPGTGNRGTG
jgi:hypothetical protein